MARIEGWDSGVQDLVLRFEGPGLEAGWSRADTGRVAELLTSLTAAARAELVLLEEQANGPLGSPVDALRAALADLETERDAARSAIEKPADSPEWVMSWRRLAVVFVGGVGVEAACVGAGVPSGWPRLAIIAAIASLIVLGPRDLLVVMSMMVLRTQLAWQSIRRQRRLVDMTDEMHVLRGKIREAEKRSSLVEPWVSMRLSFLRERFEAQRKRAAIASEVSWAANSRQQGQSSA